MSRQLNQSLYLLIIKGDFEVRGEIYMPEKKSFEQLNQQRQDNGEALFANHVMQLQEV